MVSDDRAQVVKEPSAVLMLPNEVRIGQNTDHREIVRFLSQLSTVAQEIGDIQG
jgi:hypothetical protein